jgi:hypothetical protein
MSSYKNLPPSVLKVALWVPEDVLGQWYKSDPDAVTLVATEAANLLGDGTARPEDELLVARLVISGGDEVDLLRLAASGLLVNREAFHRAATWVKRRRTSHAIIHLPEAQDVRERIVGRLGPLGWDSPSVPDQQAVIEAIRAFENDLMAWHVISKAPTVSAMRRHVLKLASRMGFGVGRAPMSLG